MTWLTEDPTWVIVIGILVEAALGFVVVMQYRRELLWAMGGVALVVALLVGVEAYIVTDREQVEATLDAGVAALEANDQTRVEALLAPSATKTRGRVAWALATVEFTEIHLSDLEILVKPHTEPPTATATFDAFFHFNDRTGMIPYRNYGSRIKMDLEQIGDRWLVTDHWEYEALQP